MNLLLVASLIALWASVAGKPSEEIVELTRRVAQAARELDDFYVDVVDEPTLDKQRAWEFAERLNVFRDKKKPLTNYDQLTLQDLRQLRSASGELAKASPPTPSWVEELQRLRVGVKQTEPQPEANERVQSREQTHPRETKSDQQVEPQSVAEFLGFHEFLSQAQSAEAIVENDMQPAIEALEHLYQDAGLHEEATIEQLTEATQLQVRVPLLEVEFPVTTAILLITLGASFVMCYFVSVAIGIRRAAPRASEGEGADWIFFHSSPCWLGFLLGAIWIVGPATVVPIAIIGGAFRGFWEIVAGMALFLFLSGMAIVASRELFQARQILLQPLQGTGRGEQVPSGSRPQ